MSCECTSIEMAYGCLSDSSDGSKRTIKIYTEFGRNAAGNIIVVATRYANADDTLITLSATQSVSVGACANACPPVSAQGVVSTWG